MKIRWWMIVLAGLAGAAAYVALLGPGEAERQADALEAAGENISAAMTEAAGEAEAKAKDEIERLARD